MSVTVFKTTQELERKKVGDLISDLVAAYERGEVVDVLFAYSEKDGATSYAISGNMKIRDFSYIVAVLQWRLNGWIEKS